VVEAAGAVAATDFPAAVVEAGVAEVKGSPAAAVVAFLAAEGRAASLAVAEDIISRVVVVAIPAGEVITAVAAATEAEGAIIGAADIIAVADTITVGPVYPLASTARLTRTAITIPTTIPRVMLTIRATTVPRLPTTALRIPATMTIPDPTAILVTTVTPTPTIPTALRMATTTKAQMARRTTATHPDTTIRTAAINTIPAARSIRNKLQ